jgi:hypothetical protein
VSVRRCVHHKERATTTSTELHPHDVAGYYDDEIETAYHRWRDAGSPTADQWTFTVTPQATADLPAAHARGHSHGFSRSRMGG